MKKIMIVDDDKDFLDSFSDVLIKSGYKTIPLNESRLAVLEAYNSKPDLIILDLMMDVFSGFEIAAQLRGICETKHIPVIGITGFYTEKDDCNLINDCGITKCFTKPVNIPDMIEAIEKSIP